MALDGIYTSLISQELNEKLQGARIDKIFMPDKFTILILIRTATQTEKLMISINPSCARVSLTENSRENPKMPPSFCMLLRKYLSGSRILSITCPNYERIVEIAVTTTDELHDTKTLRLIVELMGRYCNAILVNPQDRIIDSAVHVDLSVSKVREVMPARIYEYPPKQNKMLPEEAIKLCDKGLPPIIDEEINRPAEKALLNSVMGFSPLLAKQLICLCGSDERAPFKLMSDKEKTKLVTCSQTLLEKICKRDISPSVYFSKDGQPVEFCFTDLYGFDSKKECASLSETIETYYYEREADIDFEQKRQRLLTIINTALSHASKKAEIHTNDCEEGRKSDIWKKYGDLILCYTYLVKPKDTSLTCIDIYDENQNEITLTLDPSLSAADNAQEYFKKFRKAKRKLELSSMYLEDDLSAVEYLRSLRTAILNAVDKDDLDSLEYEMNPEHAGLIKQSKDRKDTNKGKADPNTTVGKSKSGKASSRALRAAALKAHQSEKNKSNRSDSRRNEECYRKFTTKDGFAIYSGRNNIQNDFLTFKVADKNDWWFHVKGTPGTHVILVSKSDDMPSDSAFEKAAQIAAFYSKQTVIEERLHNTDSKPGSIKIDVDYCQVSHVKKIPKAKPGMVIYEGYYSITVESKNPLED